MPEMPDTSPDQNLNVDEPTPPPLNQPFVEPDPVFQPPPRSPRPAGSRTKWYRSRVLWFLAGFILSGLIFGSLGYYLWGKNRVREVRGVKEPLTSYDLSAFREAMEEELKKPATTSTQPQSGQPREKK